jgi:hypothetical protein
MDETGVFSFLLPFSSSVLSLISHKISVKKGKKRKKTNSDGKSAADGKDGKSRNEEMNYFITNTYKFSPVENSAVRENCIHQTFQQ